MRRVRSLLVFMCVVAMAMSCFTVESSATGYSRDRATNFAIDNYNNLVKGERKGGDCTVYVRTCAEKGGIRRDADKPGYNPGDYVDYLVEQGMATKIKMVPAEGDRYMGYNVADNPQAKVGDIIAYVCCNANTSKHKKVFHLSMLTSITDDGEILISKHNSYQLNGRIYPKHARCGTDEYDNSVYLIHIQPSSKWMKTVGKVSVKKKSGKAVKVSWTKTASDCKYQISKSKSGAKSKCKVVKTVKKSSAKSTTVSASKGTTYYYRVRTYKVVNGKKFYGPWSKAVSYRLK